MLRFYSTKCFSSLTPLDHIFCQTRIIYQYKTNIFSHIIEKANVSSFRGVYDERKVIFLVDMQSFYASVEKAENPHLKNRPVIVSGDPERRGGVVLVACPLAKQRGWRMLRGCGRRRKSALKLLCSGPVCAGTLMYHCKSRPFRGIYRPCGAVFHR